MSHLCEQCFNQEICTIYEFHQEKRKIATAHIITCDYYQEIKETKKEEIITNSITPSPVSNVSLIRDTNSISDKIKSLTKKPTEEEEPVMIGTCVACKKETEVLSCHHCGNHACDNCMTFDPASNNNYCPYCYD